MVDLDAAIEPFLEATVRQNPYVPIQPTVPQLAFLALQHTEALYGGAAGGGKSVALLAAALQYVDQPGYHALLLRRTFRDLSQAGALIQLSQLWLAGTAATWSGQDKRWTFPSGATLTFGYCEHEADVYQYQGAQVAFIGVDELTQWPEFAYTYLFSRLRRPVDATFPLRMRAASNPGGIGHSWVRKRFILGGTEDRIFVPAKLDDNPHLDRETYLRGLTELDPITYAQLRHGDWSATHTGGVFAADALAWQRSRVAMGTEGVVVLQ